MSDQSPSCCCTTPVPGKPWKGWAVFLAVMVLVLLGVLLATSIMERRVEAKLQMPLVPIADLETDNATWGVNFPREYDAYKRMAETATRTKHGGADPRDLLAETPANVMLFSGYPFAKDYRQARGHLFAVEDVTGTKRINDKTTGSCWTCKSPGVVKAMAEMGPEAFYKAKFADLKRYMQHPIGCLDCHDPKTMRLRISRPALREAWQRQGKDIDQASHQEMRSLVCAQCHVEYYFKGESKYVTFPWDKGTSIEQIDAYYDEVGFSDWTHAISKAPMVKMQHPDYEVYSKGIHAYRNVACADCHMPYKSEGGAKFSDHHVQSPLLNISNSCAVCHRWSETEIKGRVEAIQDKIQAGRASAEVTVARAHLDIAAAMQAGVTDEELKPLRTLVRKAQVRWDYVAANNGMGFHAPQECQRILGDAIALASEVRLQTARLLARKGYLAEVLYPDFSSKEKAQALDVAFREDKGPVLLAK